MQMYANLTELNTFVHLIYITNFLGVFKTFSLAVPLSTVTRPSYENSVAAAKLSISDLPEWDLDE